LGDTTVNPAHVVTVLEVVERLITDTHG